MRLFNVKFDGCHPHGNMPALEGYVSKEIHDHIKRIILTNDMNDEWYKKKKTCYPFFQGGVEYTDGWVRVGFWTGDVKAAFAFTREMLKPFTYDVFPI